MSIFFVSLLWSTSLKVSSIITMKKVLIGSEESFVYIRPPGPYCENPVVKIYYKEIFSGGVWSTYNNIQLGTLLGIFYNPFIINFDTFTGIIFKNFSLQIGVRFSPKNDYYKLLYMDIALRLTEHKINPIARIRAIKEYPIKEFYASPWENFEGEIIMPFNILKDVFCFLSLSSNFCIYHFPGHKEYSSTKNIGWEWRIGIGFNTGEIFPLRISTMRKTETWIF